MELPETVENLKLNNPKRKTAEIYLAGGCFWGLEKYMSGVHGVISTDVGYANGTIEYPTYRQVCTMNTGFAETVHVVYDPLSITLKFLLELYYKAIDPISVNRQGRDVGSQYRTGIYFVNPNDEITIRESIEKLQKEYLEPIAIEIKRLENYFLAEEYHQKYLDKNPNGYCHISPRKMEQAKQAIIDTGRYTAPKKERLEGLTPLQAEVTQHNMTEPPFNNEYWNHFEPGVYVDITTGEPLFLSDDKFESGCGWPSFSKPVDPDVLRVKPDKSHGMVRTEVRSRTGDAHLGHVFTDGPREKGGLRYCINSASVRFIPKDRMEKEGYGYLLPYVK